MRMIYRVLVSFSFILFSQYSVFAKETYITAAALLDVSNGKILQNPAVIIRDKHIVAIGPQDSISKPKGAEHIDLPGATLMPGMMDMHVHLSGDAATPFYESMAYSVPRRAVIGVKNAQKTLLAGFTTVRDLGDKGYGMIGVRDSINAGDVFGPRIISVGHSLGITGGHCDNNFLPPETAYTAGGVADGIEGVRRKVRENIKYGADAIKFCATGGVFSKGTKVGI